MMNNTATKHERERVGGKRMCAFSFNRLMTFQAIVSGGDFAFQVRASLNRGVVTGVAVPVIGQLVINLRRRRLALLSYARQLFAVVARLQVATATGLDADRVRCFESFSRQDDFSLGGLQGRLERGGWLIRVMTF